MSNPTAYFDTLFLGGKMTDLVEGFSRPELHLFAYASCLVSIYEGQPVSEWGYDFVAAATGLPFAPEIDAAIDAGLEIDQIALRGSLYAITADGDCELTVLRTFQDNQARERFLAGAADTLLVLNPGNVREAFDYDPNMRFLKEGHRTDWLLKKPIEERLHDNFQQLRQLLQYDAQDLSVPLVTWLKYLLQTGRTPVGHAD